MGEIIDRARAIRAGMEEVSAVLTDERAVELPEFFPAWNPESTYAAGDRIRYEGTLYKVLQGHTSQPSWTPVEAHALFAAVLPGQDGTEIGEWQQPDSTNPYSKGDRVTYNGKTYESLIDGNVWSPEAYPAGWKEI